MKKERIERRNLFIRSIFRLSSCVRSWHHRSARCTHSMSSILCASSLSFLLACSFGVHCNIFRRVVNHNFIVAFTYFYTNEIFLCAMLSGQHSSWNEKKKCQEKYRFGCACHTYKYFVFNLLFDPYRDCVRVHICVGKCFDTFCTPFFCALVFDVCETARRLSQGGKPMWPISMVRKATENICLLTQNHFAMIVAFHWIRNELTIWYHLIEAQSSNKNGTAQAKTKKNNEISRQSKRDFRTELFIKKIWLMIDILSLSFFFLIVERKMIFPTAEKRWFWTKIFCQVQRRGE